MDSERLKENVTVTVRFRPLSPREIRQGEEIAWYADGETIVRNEYTSSIAYAYDQVFGPTTTTRHLYDIAAQHVVSGAMEGINGTIFAYGVTSSGKTHTMHGNQRSPGIVPLAIKHAFSIIQETPCREFLLRLSYLEIYNEVVNDLLNPAGKNLRIREDTQGTFVDGVKEEVVLSPAHALSIIAAGEEQRHVGSTNLNLHSSRSHTIFTMTIESSPCSENNEDEAVNLSQLNLIDLAGSESSKAETTGIRRKEGAYINKSLLTLGTVISKLSDGRAAHIPYRDSKLTRLLQSSLSGHGRVSLICTVTPSSSNSEETHNTLKFAHRAKHIEINTSQNKIIDEKSLIKTYQNEIRSLKEELDELEREIVTVPQLKHTGAKDALLSQIQSLTKLILVSTKSSHQSDPGIRYSFGEEELVYLPERKRDLSLDHENIDLHVTINGGIETKEDKKIKKPGLLKWLKPQKRDGLTLTLTSGSDKSSTPSTPASSHILPIVESRPSYSSLSEATSVGFLLEHKQDLDINKEVEVAYSEVIEEQLTQKNNELKGLDETITSLKQQLGSEKNEKNTDTNHSLEIEHQQLKEKIVNLTESKERLESENTRLKEQNSYAKELASAAAMELNILCEEIIKLMNQNEKLSAELAAHSSNSTSNSNSNNNSNSPRNTTKSNGHRKSVSQLELLKREVAMSKEREMAYEAVLSEKSERESELEQMVMESNQREEYLENELANMWILVSRLRKSEDVEIDASESSKESGFEISEDI
ncbi:kinesin-like protein KIN-7K, chloroplastic [Lactuca sativa]|uniref:kinesin-like protein KIN-7K, chloroplastic n=1 Tax=Lactuca sativa TaxID=4236 RepID=UPI000CA7E948|nr:kinesin-like protein KIN-7K, chloroplastic [Lactuca sativa]